MALRQHLLPEDRLRVITDLIRERGSVRGRDLVDVLGVTDETIRRDLARLAEQGLVRRAHGGAVALRASDETDTSFRLREHEKEKMAIGGRAGGPVGDRSPIILRPRTPTLCPAPAPHAREAPLRGPTAATKALQLVGRPRAPPRLSRRGV